MNSKGEPDEASRGSEASSSNTNSAPDTPTSENTSSLCSDTDTKNTQDIMKRAAAKQLIERYFYQLLDGCGNPNCDNKYCASSGEARNLTPNEAAAEAIKLFHKEARLCDSLPNKVPRTDTSCCESSASNTCTPHTQETIKHDKINDSPSSSRSPLNRTCEEKENETSQSVSHQNDHKNLSHSNGAPLTEDRIYQLCDECLLNKVPQPLIRALGEAFTQPALLAKSFPGKVSVDIDMEKKGKNVKKSKSKAMCSSSDPDKDIDSVAGPGLDVTSCRRAFHYLSKVPSEYYSSAVVTALTTLAEYLKLDLRSTKKMCIDDVVNCFVIAFEVPDLGCSDYLEIALPALCQAAEFLPVKGQAKLARVWAQHCKETLRHILETLQQLITLRVISTNYTRNFQVQDDFTVAVATKLMKIVYYANMLAGVMESNTLREEAIVIDSQSDPLGGALDHLYPLSPLKNSKQSQPEDLLAKELDINVLDARKPHLPFEEFYNEPLSDTIKMDIDFANYKIEIRNEIPSWDPFSVREPGADFLNVLHGDDESDRESVVEYFEVHEEDDLDPPLSPPRHSPLHSPVLRQSPSPARSRSPLVIFAMNDEEPSGAGGVVLDSFDDEGIRLDDDVTPADDEEISMPNAHALFSLEIQHDGERNARS